MFITSLNLIPLGNWINANDANYVLSLPMSNLSDSDRQELRNTISSRSIYLMDWNIKPQ